MTKQPTIIAIGGGSLTGMNTPASTQSIDRAILEAARVKKPRVLFIPLTENPRAFKPGDECQHMHEQSKQ